MDEKRLEKIETALEFLMYAEWGRRWCSEDGQWEERGFHEKT